MTNMFRRLQLVCGVAFLSMAVGCADDTKEPGQNLDTGDDLPPLVDAATLLPSDDGYDSAPKTEFDGKFDVTLPKKFDLIDIQSPVRNQASRGVCSVFSTVGLMEHLYIKEGTITKPDFSEQYLQWSAKVEAKGFANVGGSSGKVNLDAIHRFGIVEESVSPYEKRGWSSTNDEECVSGEKNLPTKCYTNGTPSEEALAAEKFKLPASKWQSSRTDSLKTYMFQNKTAVIAGMTFFYQSWSHGGSKFGINADNKSTGTVVYPGEHDKTHSLEKRAGHSILLVGWDDEHTAPRLDEDGKPMLNEDGDPVFEKGFFIFKNSWGATGSWSAKSPYKKGYGLLSYRYVAEYGRAVSTSIPKITQPKVEICGDGIDNDGKDGSDCEDAACSAEAMCQTTETDTRTYTDDAKTAIPDNNSDGLTRTIEVDQSGRVEALILEVDIEHSWIGDVSIILESPGGDIAIVKENDGASGDGFKKTFTLKEFTNKNAAGTWTIHVADDAKFDTGALKSWSLSITTGE